MTSSTWMRTSHHKNRCRRFSTTPLTPSAVSSAARSAAAINPDDPVAALALLRPVRPFELNQVGTARRFFAELQTPADHVEIRVALLDDAAIHGAQPATDIK